MKPYSIFLQRNGTYFLNKTRIYKYFFFSQQIINHQRTLDWTVLYVSFKHI